MDAVPDHSTAGADGLARAAPTPAPVEPPEPITVDCDRCAVRGAACGDCVVTVLLGPPSPRVELDPEELTALDALAGAGLVPPLRLVRACDPPPRTDADAPDVQEE